MQTAHARTLLMIVLVSATFALPLRRLSMMARFPQVGNDLKQISPPLPNRPRAPVLIVPRLARSESGWEGGRGRFRPVLSKVTGAFRLPVANRIAPPSSMSSMARTAFPLRC